MSDPTKPSESWGASPTAKEKNAVQRSVTALLDALAPERVLKRAEQLTAPVEQHRTPSGCVLQTSDCALSVSWFGEASNDAAMGELHVILWHGTVARRGATRDRKGATIISEMIVRPLEPPADGFLWQATDGSQYTTASLAAHCLSLLEAQVRAAGEPPATRQE